MCGFLLVFGVGNLMIFEIPTPMASTIYFWTQLVPFLLQLAELISKMQFLGIASEIKKMHGFRSGVRAGRNGRPKCSQAINLFVRCIQGELLWYFV